MKKGYVIGLLTTVFVVFIGSVATAQVAGYYATTDPENPVVKPPTDPPWKSAQGGYPMPTNVGGQVWLGRLNGYVNDQKEKEYTLRITGPEPQKYGVSVTGYINATTTSHTASVTGIKDIPGDPPSREFTIYIKPQPEWEVIELTRTVASRDGRDQTYEAEQDSNCDYTQTTPSGFEMYGASFGVAGDPTRTTRVAVFPDTAELVNDAEAHSFDGPGGPWEASMVYQDPDGVDRVGIEWTTAGSGLTPDDEYSWEVVMESPREQQSCSYYAYDEERARYVYFRVPVPPIIPAVSEWGLVVLTLAGLTAGTIMFTRRRRARAAA